MKSNFLKSVVAGVACLTLVSSCKMMEKAGFHKCAGSKSEKSEKNSCPAKGKECDSTKKAERKAEKRAKKEAAKKESVVKTEEKKN